MQIKKLVLIVMLTGLFMVPAFAGAADSNLIARPPGNRYVYITNPVDGSTVSGLVTITLDTNANCKIYIDGQRVAVGSAFNWDTTAYADGSHTIYASTNGASDTVTVTVDNGEVPPPPPPNEAPVVTIETPNAGATLSGSVTITVSVTDDADTLTADIYIDSVFITTADEYVWDTTAYADGSHTIYAEATDSGDLSDSDQISVTVDNTVEPPPPPEDNVLTDGETGYGNLATDDDYFTWQIEVLENANGMHVVLNCGSADFDFFASSTTNDPTHTNNEFEGYTYGGEDVTFGSPAAGTWFIKVDAYSDAPSDYDITVTITYNEPLTWGNGGKYAIVVGISDYQSISDLSYCDEDASDWYYQLVDLGYEVKVFGDSHTNDYPIYTNLATEANVRNAMTSLAAHAQAGDDVVFTTSGHGSGDGRGSSFLCMYDCSGSAGCYYDTELAADIGQFTTGVNIFVFIDHCYSGGMGPELMALSNAQYILCLTTCTEDGYGWDSPDHNNGLWTAYFLEVSWEGYYNNNPSIDMESVFQYAHDNYPKSGGDEPMIFDGNSIELFYL